MCTNRSLGHEGAQNPRSVVVEVALEDLCQVQQGRACGEGGTLHEALLVEDKEVGGTGQDNGGPVHAWPGRALLHVRDKAAQELSQVPGECMSASIRVYKLNF